MGRTSEQASCEQGQARIDELLDALERISVWSRQNAEFEVARGLEGAARPWWHVLYTALTAIDPSIND